MTTLALAALTGCTSSATPSVERAPTDPTQRSAQALSGSLTVFAAASLTETFADLADRFMAAHPGVEVVLSFAGSSSLAAQITAGAPADVFAAASAATMATVADAGSTAQDPVVFAHTTLEIAVPAGNPARITGLSDLADETRTIALCATEVPCGAAAATAFAAAGLTPAPDTLEQDVKAVLARVTSGEVDAGLVYVTDVVAAGGAVEGIAFPEAADAVTEYQVAVLTEARRPDLAQEFVAFVRSPQAQEALADAGFTGP
ncbi:MAG: molybdate ABC transporter substrate-binding protein [Cellulomonadaceae bacterium]|nr:molybdate ABC transporter substrate-binding protein [Cellulomonadaceae bacterium]